MLKVSLLALVGLCMVLAVCGSVHANEPTGSWPYPKLTEYDPTDGTITENFPNCTYDQSTGNYTVFATNKLYGYDSDVMKFEYNKTIDPYLKIFRVYYVIADQIWVSTGYTKFNKPEYLNAAELQSMLDICNNTLQHGQDLLNQTVVLSNQGKMVDCVKTYIKFLKIDAVTPMILQTRLNIVYALCSLNVPGYYSNRGTDQDAEAYAKYFEYDSAEARQCVFQIISDMEAADKEATYQNWINATGIKMEPGNYEGSTKTTTPLGNYTVTFETRLSTGKSIGNTIVSTEVGSGKDYHTETFKVDTFGMYDGTPYLKISIARYTGSAKYKPTMPFDGYDKVNKNNYEPLDPSSIQIDGHTARLYKSYSIKHDTWPNRYAITYELDPNTFVMIETYMIDYDKDVSLLIDTLHIEKKTK